MDEPSLRLIHNYQSGYLEQLWAGAVRDSKFARTTFRRIIAQSAPAAIRRMLDVDQCQSRPSK